MRTKFLFIILVISLFVSACGGTENNPQATQKEITVHEVQASDPDGIDEDVDTTLVMVEEVSSGDVALPLPPSGDNTEAWAAMFGVADDPYQTEFDYYFYQWVHANCTYVTDFGGLSHWTCHQPLLEAADDLLYEINLDSTDAALMAAITLTPGFFLDDGIVGVVWAGDKIVKLVVTSSAAILTAEGITAFARHSDPSHDPRFSDTAQQAIKDIKWKTQQWFTDPNKTGPLLCGMAILKTGGQQFRIFDAATGWLYFYQDGGWTSAFPTAKNIVGFMNSTPRGVSEFNAYNPIDGGDAFKMCISILKGSPPADAFK